MVVKVVVMVVVVWRKLESTKRAGKPGEAKSKRAIRPRGKKETGGGKIKVSRGRKERRRKNGRQKIDMV